jgi:cell division protein FtsW
VIDRRPPDAVLLIVTGLLTAIGIVMVFSASSAVAYTQYHDAGYYLKRELLWAAIGIAALVLGMKLDYTKLRPAAPWIFVLAVVLLAAVLVPSLGFVEGGARRWLSARFFTFEPSEFTKLALVLFLANLFSARSEGAASFSRAGFPALFAVGICFALVMREPDLGTASLYLLTTFVLLFVAGAPLLQLALEAAIAIPALLIFIYSSAYRRDRFLAFLHPWRDPQGTGYHIIQSLYALGSGGLFGLGLGQSRQKFGYLPAQHTDFIFSIIGEELGFVGAVAIVFLFLAFAYQGIRIASRAEDRFGFYLAVGLTTSIVLQALINVGVVTASWPVTGVPLPFISYGGTSLVITLFSVGLLASISRGRRRAAASLPATRQKVS